MDDERITRITLRIPKLLDERLDAEADRTSKSKNAEIVARLERSFSSTDEVSSDLLLAFARQARDLAESEFSLDSTRLGWGHTALALKRAADHLSAGTKPSEKELQEWEAFRALAAREAMKAVRRHDEVKEQFASANERYEAMQRHVGASMHDAANDDPFRREFVSEAFERMKARLEELERNVPAPSGDRD